MVEKKKKKLMKFATFPTRVCENLIIPASELV